MASESATNDAIGAAIASAINSQLCDSARVRGAKSCWSRYKRLGKLFREQFLHVAPQLITHFLRQTSCFHCVHVIRSQQHTNAHTTQPRVREAALPAEQHTWLELACRGLNVRTMTRIVVRSDQLFLCAIDGSSDSNYTDLPSAQSEEGEMLLVVLLVKTCLSFDTTSSRPIHHSASALIVQRFGPSHPRSKQQQQWTNLIASEATQIYSATMKRTAKFIPTSSVNRTITCSASARPPDNSCAHTCQQQ